MSYWCEMCGELEAVANPFPWIPGGEARAHRAGCQGGRVIPIATLCSEPTVIDESDLAPGMVVVGVDDNEGARAFLGPPGMMLTETLGWVWCESGEMRALDCVVDDRVREIAGVRP